MKKRCLIGLMFLVSSSAHAVVIQNPLKGGFPIIGTYIASPSLSTNTLHQWCSENGGLVYVTHTNGASLAQVMYYGNAWTLAQQADNYYAETVTCEAETASDAGAGVGISAEAEAALVETNESLDTLVKIVAAIGSLSLLFMGFNSGMHR